MSEAEISERKRITIIAEAGVNHNGDLDTALRLVDAAAQAGADIIKFQTFNASALACETAPRAAYQLANSASEESQLDMLRRLELKPQWHREIMAYCHKKSLGFLSTPFDLPSIDLLESLGMGIYKIPSGEITNLPYLRHIAHKAKEIILSTGMSTLEEVGAALDALGKAGARRSAITLLHCTTEYPAPIAEVNLRAMATMRDAFPGIRGVGYSDHTAGIAIPIAAAALGAVLIEKHFTLDRNMDGPDHAASLEPNELKDMVQAIRQVELALGSSRKAPSPSELVNRPVVRKSIVAARNIQAGEVLNEENLTSKRPGTGLSPMLWDRLIGTRAARDYPKDSQI